MDEHEIWAEELVEQAKQDSRVLRKMLFLSGGECNSGSNDIFQVKDGQGGGIRCLPPLFLIERRCLYGS